MPAKGIDKIKEEIEMLRKSQLKKHNLTINSLIVNPQNEGKTIRGWIEHFNLPLPEEFERDDFGDLYELYYITILIELGMRGEHGPRPYHSSPPLWKNLVATYKLTRVFDITHSWVDLPAQVDLKLRDFITFPKIICVLAALGYGQVAHDILVQYHKQRIYPQTGTFITVGEQLADKESAYYVDGKFDLGDIYVTNQIFQALHFPYRRINSNILERVHEILEEDRKDQEEADQIDPEEMVISI